MRYITQAITVIVFTMFLTPHMDLMAASKDSRIRTQIAALQPGDQVKLKLASGSEATGRLESLAKETVTLQVEGLKNVTRITYRIADITEVMTDRAGPGIPELNPELRKNAGTHAFAAVGGCQHGVALFGAGGGGEGFITNNLALSGDVGVYSFTDTNLFGLAAANATIHFGSRYRLRGADPYLTGGWALAFAGGSFASGINAGGGLNYWMNDRMGLRWEARAHIFGGESALISRVGITFR